MFLRVLTLKPTTPIRYHLCFLCSPLVTSLLICTHGTTQSRLSPFHAPGEPGDGCVGQSEMEKNLHGLAWSLFLGRIAAVRPVECGHKTDV